MSVVTCLCRKNFIKMPTNLRSFTTKPEASVPGYNVMNVFDRKSKLIQRERSAVRNDYNLYEYLREEIGWRVADRVFDVKRVFKNAAEIGCSRGYVSRHFTNDNVERITLCDTSQTLLDSAQVGDGVQVDKLLMDEEALDLAESSFDLIVSSLALHWVNDLPGCFKRVNRSLKPDGVFIACLFGGDTLYELRQALQLAETERLGGMHQHISPFTRMRDIGGILTSCGYTLQTVDLDEMQIWYPSAWQLMEDLRCMGESNASLERPLHLRRDVQMAAAAIYDEMYGKMHPEKKTRCVPATFEIIHLVGWRPDPSQAKPLPSGTKPDVSLKELHTIEDIIQDIKEHTNK